MREKEAARSADARAVNDAAGWPMPYKEGAILHGPPERLLPKGNLFSHKNALLSTAMGFHETKESKGLTVKMRCPFEGCKFALDASSKKTSSWKL